MAEPLQKFIWRKTRVVDKASIKFVCLILKFVIQMSLEEYFLKKLLIILVQKMESTLVHRQAWAIANFNLNTASIEPPWKPFRW
jgi:hypothetical protein